MRYNHKEKLNLIDTHCHLENILFEVDIDAVIQKAKECSIAIITSAINKTTWQKGIQIASKYDNVFGSQGLDPTLFHDYDLAIKSILENKNDLIAIGEIGLDHYLTRDHGERDLQERAFEKLIDVATELHLPVQVHSRSAGRAALEVLYKSDIEQVHMHAFDGKSSYARIASNEYGYYFSIPTSVVRSRQKQKLVKGINIERILVETDSPVLSAEKGTRNEPSNLPIAVKEVARILGRDYEAMVEILFENSIRLYSKLKHLR